MATEHVDFVNHVDLKAAHGWCIHRLLKQARHLINAAIRGRVKFNIVNKTTAIDFCARSTLAARRGRNAGFTIQRLGQNA